MDKLDTTSTYVHEEYRQVVSEHLCYIMRNMSTRSYIGYQKASDSILWGNGVLQHLVDVPLKLSTLLTACLAKITCH